MERMPDEILLMIKNRLHLLHRWRLATVSRRTRNIITENEAFHSIRFSKIFKDDNWAKKIMQHGMDIAIIEGSAEARHDYTGKPIFLLVITNMKDVKPETIYAQEFISSLQQQVTLETLEIEYNDFILNVSGILEYPLIASSLDAIIDKRGSGLKMNVYYYHRPSKVYSARGVNLLNAVCFINLKPEKFITVNILNNVHREERCYFRGTSELPGLFID
ncbi:hypothetical protein V8C42DRAFT_222024 [Trichoderma barbatum]